MAAGLRQRRRQVVTLQPAPGRSRVLAVGVDSYDPGCGFDPLTTCRNDALGFVDCFRDISQLGADPAAVRALVSGAAPEPSRGEIIKGLRELVRSTVAGDRVVFYFSGRVHRLVNAPDVYLVPQDAFTDDDPGCLIPLSLVEALLGGSEAGQKLVILDVTGFGEVGEALAERVPGAQGVTILASADLAAKSPNPQHSPLTAILLPALRGEEREALDERRLTVASLRRFLSRRIAVWANGPAGEGEVLADYSGPLLGSGGDGARGALFDSLELTGGGRQVAIKQILTGLSRSHYSQSYLEERANAALGEHLEGSLGRTVSRLRAQFKWASSAVTVDGAGISFPDGHYAVRYEATEKLRGVLVEELSLRAAWLGSPGLVAGLLECLQLEPVRARFSLRSGCVLARCIPKLEASGWRIESELPHRVEAAFGDCTLLLEERALTLVDLPLRELFAATPDREVVRRAAGALAVLAGG